MKRLKLTVGGLLGCALLALAPVAAAAAKPTASKTTPSNAGVLADCQSHGRLTQHYSIAQLQQALNSMPSTQAEYSNCSQIVQDQILSQEGKGHKNGGGGHASSGGSTSALVILVIVVVVIVLLAGGGYLYTRRRAGGGDSEEPPPPSS